MKMWRTLAVALAGAALFSTAPVNAHHSMLVQFDLEKPITLRGVVTQLVWTNPHSWIFVNVKCPDGRTEVWRIETGSQARMVKRGLKKTDFPTGTEVIVGAYNSRDGQLKAAGTVVTFPAREVAGREATFSLGR
jgi:hypothetical protein